MALASLTLAIAWGISRRLERATPNWTSRSVHPPAVLGVTLAILNATMLVTYTLSWDDRPLHLRATLILSLAVTVFLALQGTCRTPSPDAALLWRAFLVTMLILATALVFTAIVPVHT